MRYERAMLDQIDETRISLDVALFLRQIFNLKNFFGRHCAGRPSGGSEIDKWLAL